MRFAFHKMHGLGNDFVVIDARARGVAITAARARAIADRRTGIGCDQLILLEPVEDADLRMRIFNADGGEVEQCGNALRCVAQLTGARRMETAGGPVEAEPTGGGITIDLGTPRFGWDEIPLAYPLDTAALPVGWEGLEHGTAINVGNPHIVFFVPALDAVELERIGPIVEQDPLFPERVNVNVAQVTGPAAVKLRVWERGAGLTRACGTGACATAVAAIRRGLARSPVTVSLPGGELQVDWAPGGTIRMTGPATHVFAGEADLEAFG
ncbi:diaminopimelate epimerase [Sphingomonas sp. MAH-20]|uniref:Diaminopimelate epimerase n=1 Tax=Sphingomonas horti TaxID=2682842 RepID=A0A6I4J1F2_9SPHN|nr:MULTISPECIES: diaminopimelate epimerase [Sphingomonas]MBA2919845.1 diaminopimelate epimerase [Sphingomonas sp. CGMCC 1.13658]MVO78084.1 diaminopimelate epimerase [Sphingomonas horti]